MNRLIIFGTCSAAVSALVIGISVLSDPVLKLEIDPAVRHHLLVHIERRLGGRGETRPTPAPEVDLSNTPTPR